MISSFNPQAYKRATCTPNYSTSRAPDTYTYIYICIHIYYMCMDRSIGRYCIVKGE